MAFTAADVKKLREMTNVGMMDCKKALQATDGDMDKAVDWLREKGLAKAAKKADRVAAEGVAYATVVDGVGVIIEVNSETDFAAKTDAFLDLVKNLAVVVAKQNPADVEALKACTYPDSSLRRSCPSAKTCRSAASPVSPRIPPSPTFMPAAPTAFW